MNNTDFRQYVLNTPRRPENASPQTSTSNKMLPPSSTTSLGSRNRSFIPMTPRTTARSTPTASTDLFRAQLAEHTAQSRPTKKFKSSAAPKGSKLVSGYTDRAAARRAEQLRHEDSDVTQRVTALEEQMKLGQLDRATFELLKAEITGQPPEKKEGRGLDWGALNKAKSGEDADGQVEGKADLEAELAKLEAQEVVPKPVEEVVKKGEKAMLLPPPPPPPKQVTGQKRSRNEILAELKAQRLAAQAAAEAPRSELGSKFRKIGGDPKNKPGTSRIERDDKGGEVLISVDEDGNVKRKVRKLVINKTEDKDARAMPQPDKSLAPIGGQIPEYAKVALLRQQQQQAEEEDGDIFAGVGAEYNPLGEEAEDSDPSSSSSLFEEDGDEGATEKTKAALEKQDATRNADLTAKSAPANDDDDDDDDDAASEEIRKPAPQDEPPKEEAERPATQRRNYFNEPSTPSSPSSNSEPVNPLNDPTLLATLKRASAIQQRQEEAEQKAAESKDGEGDGKERKSALQRLKELERDRDMDDLDVGFGGSRGGDEDDEFEGARGSFAQWKIGLEGEEKEKGGQQRKRGKKEKKKKKKKKGDKDSVKDVLGVIEGRKKGGGGK